jgi:hypothetical protein
VSSKLASGNDFLMGCRNGRNSHVLCVSDTTLSAASMRARILKEITEDGYMFISMYETFKNRKNLLNKILWTRQEVQSLLDYTEK